RQLNGRNAKFLPDAPAELASALAEIACQFFQAAPIIKRPRLDPTRGGARRPAPGVDRSVPGSQLGTAAQTRAKSVLFGQRRVTEKAATACAGRPRGANRPTVNARRRHADEKETVEPRVAGDESSIAGFIVESHDQIHSLRPLALLRVTCRS